MLQRRRFFSNNKKDPEGDYIFVEGIAATIFGDRVGSYLSLPIEWSENVTLEMTVTTPAPVDKTSYICNLFGSTSTGLFEGPTLTLAGKRPPYNKTISFVYNGTTYGEQNNNIPERLIETVVKLNNNSLTIGSYIYNFESSNPIPENVYIQIFGKGTNTACQQGIIHNVKITTDSQIYNLIPCYHKNNPSVGLLYDEVRNEVYESSDTRCMFIPTKRDL